MKAVIDTVLPCGCPAARAGKVDAGPFILRYGRYLPICASGLHHHDEARLILPLRGSFSSAHAGRTFCASPGDVLYRPAGDPHVDRYATVMDCVTVLLPKEHRACGTRSPFVTSHAALGRIAWALRDEASMSDSASPLVREGIATLLTTALLGQSPVIQGRGEPPWIRKVRDRFEACRHAPPSLHEVAQESGRAPAYVAAAFKRAYGMSTGAYVRWRRLWDVRDAIDDDPTIRIADIALDSGFADQSHLGRHFRRAFGVTPAAYRSRQRNARSARFGMLS